MITKILAATSTEELEDQINVIIRNGGLWDIKYSTVWSNHANSVIYSAVLVLKLSE